MSPQMIDTVLFDLDDTLLDWSQHDGQYGENHRPHVDRLHAYLVAQGFALPATAEFFAGYWEAIAQGWEAAKQVWAGVSFADMLRETFRRAGLDPAAVDIEAAMRAFDWAPVPGVTLFADAIPTLTTLRQRGYRLGLITNSMMPMWMRDLELATYNIIDFFDVRLTSGDVGYMKPHPAIYRRALDLLAAAPERAVFVGDRPANDIAGANQVGLVSVLISPAHLDRPLNGVQPDYVITTLSELLPILDRLENEVPHDETGTE